MRLAATSSPLARRRQAGLGTLLVAVVLLLLVMVLIATVSRTMVVEQRMSANQVRAKQAHEAAQAGIDAAMTYITTGVGGTDRNGDNIADDLASVTLSTGASYRAAFCHPEDTSTAITCSDTSGTRPGCNYLDNLTPAGGNAPQEATFLNTPLIVACGWSDDNIAKKTIRQHVGAVPALADPPNNPFIAKGGVNVTGSATVTNFYNTLTIWTGNAITTIGSSGKTYIRNPAVPQPTATQAPPAPPPSSNNACGGLGCYIQTSAGAVIGPDVIASDAGLANLSDAQMFTNFTGAPDLATYRNRVGIRTLSNAEAQTLDDNGGVQGQAIVIQNNNDGTGDISLPNGTVGSRERPVVLIINGNWTGGNVTVHGAVYVTGNIVVTGSPLVYGVVLVEGTVSGSGSLDVVFDPLTAENAANRTGRPGLIPGSWRDWN
jgi:type II secretory pathway pseudopilin PulG